MSTTDQTSPVGRPADKSTNGQKRVNPLHPPGTKVPDNLNKRPTVSWGSPGVAPRGEAADTQLINKNFNLPHLAIFLKRRVTETFFKVIEKRSNHKTSSSETTIFLTTTVNIRDA